MPRPTCRLHPGGRVKRNGYYGKHGEFIRWVCVPGNGDLSHYLRRDQKVGLRVKLVGGLHGSCDECERAWLPIDGLPNADYDKFVLGEKARALARIGEGMSYRSAAHRARTRVARRRGLSAPAASSIDGRMGRDWVGQHVPVIARAYLPTRWPEAIAVDSFDVRITGFRPNGQPMQKGLALYHVLGAAGYGPSFGRAGRLWHLTASPKANEAAWREFFAQLGGQRDVKTVVCDGAVEITNAARWAFPNAEVYPCLWHLFNRLGVHLGRAGLWNSRRRIFKAFRPYRFWDQQAWDELRAVLERYLAADLTRLEDRQRQGMLGTGRWLQRHQHQIDWVLTQPHWPRDLKLLEEHLATIRDRLGDRRRSFRNLERLNLLLKLFLIDLRGDADSTEFARVMRENHAVYHGASPPRRGIDGKTLRVVGGKVLPP